MQNSKMIESITVYKICFGGLHYYTEELSVALSEISEMEIDEEYTIRKESVARHFYENFKEFEGF